MTLHATNPSALTVADLDASFDDEPRILDLRIAERLGYERPADIRELIERNRAELETYGEVFRTARKTPSAKGGRPSSEYHLNEGQILLICMFSKTANAATVRREVIGLCIAYRQGKLTAHQESPHEPTVAEIKAMRAEAALLQQRRLMIPAIKSASGPEAAHALAVRWGLVGDHTARPQPALPMPVMAAAEPPFCAGCAARRMWEKPNPAYAGNGLDPAEYHPLSDGPISSGELGILLMVRGQIARKEKRS